jgi:hypothetical protein
MGDGGLVFLLRFFKLLRDLSNRVLQCAAPGLFAISCTVAWTNAGCAAACSIRKRLEKEGERGRN